MSTTNRLSPEQTPHRDAVAAGKRADVRSRVADSAPSAAPLHAIYDKDLQWEWNIAGGEIAIFVRAQDYDRTAPDAVCSLGSYLASVVDSDRPQLAEKLEALLASGVRSFTARFRIAGADGRAHRADLFGLAIRNRRGKLVRVVARQRWIASQEGLSSSREPSPFHNEPSPFHDALTGLPNRVLFERTLASAFADAARDDNARFAVLFIDLDHFKKINDRHGHLQGDRALVAVAQRFVHCLRPDDVVARRDGDEFTVLLRGMNHPSEAAIVANRLLEHLRTPLAIQGQTLDVSASIGIALYQQNTSPAELLHEADQAMYRAKARGGDHYEIAGDPARDRLAY